VVTVSLSSWLPGGTATVVTCFTYPAQGPTDCELSNYGTYTVDIADDGTAEIDYPVAVVPGKCDETTNCYIVAGDGFGPTANYAGVEISFAGATEPEPEPTEDPEPEPTEDPEPEPTEEPEPEPTEEPEPEPTEEPEPEPTEEPEPEATPEDGDDEESDDDDDGGSSAGIIIAVVAVLAVGGGAALFLRNRNAGS
jgi:hypothetical protein